MRSAATSSHGWTKPKSGLPPALTTSLESLRCTLSSIQWIHRAEAAMCARPLTAIMMGNDGDHIDIADKFTDSTSRDPSRLDSCGDINFREQIRRIDASR